jgi:uncharacterized protein
MVNKQILKQALTDQQSEKKQILTQKLIPRETEPQVKKTLKDDLIKVVLGVRRCGKSILAHRVLQNTSYGYINFDDERLVGVESDELNTVLEILLELEPNPKYLLLDEVQNVNRWELFANRLQRQGYNLIITGSNSKLLSRELATHLTGRHASFELYPFSFREFLRYKQLTYTQRELNNTKKRAAIKRLFKDYLEGGGFPETLKVSNPELYLRELHDRIITRDVVSRYNIRYVKDIKEIALYLQTNFSSLLSYRNLKNTFQLGSVHTVKNYISYLEEAYLVTQCYPFSFKLKQQVRRNKKLYSIDTGLIKAVTSLFFPNNGNLLENLVYLELRRQGKEIYYHSESGTGGYEVDFVIKKNQIVEQIIQVSLEIAQPSTKKRELTGLLKAGKKLNCSNLLLLTGDTEGEETINNKTATVLPVWKWLLEQSV